jgi:hypothetical protein
MNNGQQSNEFRTYEYDWLGTIKTGSGIGTIRSGSYLLKFGGFVAKLAPTVQFS